MQQTTAAKNLMHVNQSTKSRILQLAP